MKNGKIYLWQRRLISFFVWLKRQVNGKTGMKNYKKNRNFLAVRMEINNNFLTAEKLNEAQGRPSIPFSSSMLLP